MNLKVIEDTAVQLLKLAVTVLPEDVKNALEKAYKKEESEAAKTQLEAILKNIKLAEKTSTPICQDTGIIIFYVKVGADFKGFNKIEECLIRATRRATKEVPLRPNAVNPFTGENSGDNTGRFIPYIEWEITSGENLEITVLPKGGGSENMCALAMLTPGEGLNGLKRFVVDTVIKAGAKPCPPVILGIGVGGSSDIALKLAKKAILRPLDEPNPDPTLRELEKKLIEAVNMTGIGAMGVGGKITALGVHIEYAYRHVASYPVGLAFQCWAARRASARIYADGSVEYLTHKVR